VPDGSREKLIDECLRELGQGGRVVSASAAFNIGIEQLEREIASMAAANAGESVIVSNIRHRQSLQAASDSLSHALATTASSEMIDLLSVDLTAARNALGLITGETATEDLLDRIFSEFCIGK
jgi:tRNA modification GTPase